ncbi:LodA/GoxA family CTQ-dependent oxidase [Stigmatella sp. ncwal1]|uniref:LodA/GoxA family CTQ-dependent oxidase n=1 Tax=Stigmatella ashevillensis TaxID=2995309 RepID=A0ABT5DJD8_9BACT|nr:LodA/GoxA family CTQ-dependent oxidase [Stigmatella ashevillena]MDC0713772.1 LodA/GoxA family CTQ-dependent oxidase [Stigmatella ashevillena]
MTRFFRIHPAVGIARVGNSPDEFFIGPEHPNQPPNFDITQKKFLPFKDSQGRIKRQAARFRVFEYTMQNGALTPLREVTSGSSDVVSIKWNVHLANRKAAFFRFNGQDGAEAGVWKGADPEPNQPRINLRNAHVQGEVERKRLLLIDPGLKSISGRIQTPVPLTNPNGNIPIATLGELRTDENGNLLVLGGHGQSKKTANGKLIDDYVNNDHWFDDMSDGPVSAEITYQEGGTNQTVKLEGKDGAWLLVGPPDFAPAVGNVVRLFDTLWDLAVRSQKVPLADTDGLFNQGLFARLKQQRADWSTTTHSFQNYKPSFRLEVFPILERALGHRHVHNPEASKAFHATLAGVEQDLGSVASVKGNRLRKTIFNYLRDPFSTTLEPLLMPKGLGDFYSDYASDEGMDTRGYFMTLTKVQYAVLKRWSEGEFQEDWDEKKAHAIDPDITAGGLDRASMENGVGAPFFPGIDCSWLVRRPELYAAPFRIHHSGVVFPTTAKLAIGPGFFSQQMALPWQADFYQCKKQFFDPKSFKKNTVEGDGMYHMWWAAHRPDDVYAKKGDIQMVPWTRSLEAVAEVEARKPEIKNSAPEGTSAVEMAMYLQVQQNWSQLGFVINEGDAYFETQERSAPTGVAAVRSATRLKLKSWKADYLCRADAAPGITSAASGAGTEWNVEWLSDTRLKLKSVKGDYLQRSDAAQGVTPGATAAMTEWIIETANGKFTLKSSKGDCLHRAAEAGSVTTWSDGVGNLWEIEVLARAKV